MDDDDDGDDDDDDDYNDDDDYDHDDDDVKSLTTLFLVVHNQEMEPKFLYIEFLTSWLGKKSFILKKKDKIFIHHFVRMFESSKIYLLLPVEQKREKKIVLALFT